MKIKICGQNNPRIIEHCLNLPIDYQGLIFYEKSPRNISVDTLKIIKQYYSQFNNKFVGVFVNPTLHEIEEKLNIFDFHTIQLHGSEDQKFINEVKSKFQKQIFKTLSPEALIENNFSNVDYFLIEGKPEKNEQPGGNNKTWNWSEFSNPKKLPFILSGGLNESNVLNAINLTGADFVDINSGVEEKKGEKNLSLIDRLVSSLKSNEKL
ncbi:phosphoribosylanthranilate isomerase [Alphaproteobacteria bacterium]|jgi:phosphoribosylanthranilate isomerase|nr:phosphoribosylanthranilate isomerase [Alphaproteobacteria bacterium]